MSTDPSPKGWVYSAYLTAALALAAGFVLIGLALPRAIAYAYLSGLPAGFEITLKQGRNLAPEALNSSIELYQSALQYQPDDSDLQLTLGRLLMRRARNSSLSAAEQQQALNQAEKCLRTALSLAPSRSYIWSLNALILADQSRPASEVEGFLRNAYYLGPHEASSILLRADVGTRYWDELSEDIRSNTRVDWRQLWSLGPLRPELIRIYLRASYGKRSELRRAVLLATTDREVFDRMVLKQAGVTP